MSRAALEQTMKHRSCTLYVAAMLFGAAGVAQGQATTTPPPRGVPGRGAGMMAYDTSKVVSVSGVISAIDTLAPQGPGPGPGLHFTLKAGKETYPVEVGPVPYLKTQTLRLKIGDSVTVRGAKVLVSTVPTLMAGEIVRGKEKLALRDAAGMPLWRGMMQPRR
jgi:hypothetical protein